MDGTPNAGTITAVDDQFWVTGPSALVLMLGARVILSLAVLLQLQMYLYRSTHYVSGHMAALLVTLTCFHPSPSSQITQLGHSQCSSDSIRIREYDSSYHVQAEAEPSLVYCAKDQVPLFASWPSRSSILTLSLLSCKCPLFSGIVFDFFDLRLLLSPFLTRISIILFIILLPSIAYYSYTLSYITISPLSLFSFYIFQSSQSSKQNIQQDLASILDTDATL